MQPLSKVHHSVQTLSIVKQVTTASASTIIRNTSSPTISTRVAHLVVRIPKMDANQQNYIILPRKNSLALHLMHSTSQKRKDSLHINLIEVIETESLKRIQEESMSFLMTL